VIFREVCTFTEEEILLDQEDLSEGDSAGSEGHELSWEELWLDPNDIAESDVEV
jgi:hypothetical protein